MSILVLSIMLPLIVLATFGGSNGGSRDSFFIRLQNRFGSLLCKLARQAASCFCPPIDLDRFGEGKSVRIRHGRAAVMDTIFACKCH